MVATGKPATAGRFAAGPLAARFRAAFCRCARALVLAALFLAALAQPLPAEVLASAETRLFAGFRADGDTFAIIERGDADYPAATGGSFSLGLDSRGQDAVRGSARISVDPDGKLVLERAYAKARFPWPVGDTSLRITAGKAPLSWGRGFVFNAGDPVFGAIPAVTEVSFDEYRTAADWMGTVYLPLGAFSFAELVFLPPVDTTAVRGGGRVCLAPRWSFLQSAEAGWLHRTASADGSTAAADDLYLALDGSLWLDWYASASRLGGEYLVSFGVFRMFSAIPEVPLAFRAEGLVYPAHNYQLWYPSLTASLTGGLQAGVQGLLATGEGYLPGIGGAASVPADALLVQADTALGGLLLQWSPLKEITLSGTVLQQFEKGDPWKPRLLIECGSVFRY